MPLNHMCLITKKECIWDINCFHCELRRKLPDYEITFAPILKRQRELHHTIKR